MDVFLLEMHDLGGESEFLVFKTQEGAKMEVKEQGFEVCDWYDDGEDAIRCATPDETYSYRIEKHKLYD